MENLKLLYRKYKKLIFLLLVHYQLFELPIWCFTSKILWRFTEKGELKKVNELKLLLINLNIYNIAIFYFYFCIWTNLKYILISLWYLIITVYYDVSPTFYILYIRFIWYNYIYYIIYIYKSKRNSLSSSHIISIISEHDKFNRIYLNIYGEYYNLLKSREMWIRLSKINNITFPIMN